MKVKIISLNVWRYYEWDKRKNVLIDFLNNMKPDIVFLQETIHDSNFSSRNQTQEIADALKYPYIAFASTGLKFSQRGEKLKVPIQIGQGVISKYSIKSVENIFLKRNPLDKENRVLQNIACEIKGKEIMFSNIHFSNNDDWAEEHFQEVLELFNERKEKRVLLGDFNIKNLGDYSSLYQEFYQSSAELFDYRSYPKKCENLDYVLLPKEYKFNSFKCMDVEISDHLPLCFEISRTSL